MIRLLVAMVVCLALHPAAAATHAHERTIGVAGGDVATPPLGDAHLDCAPPPLWAAMAPPSLLAMSPAAPRSFRAVARLWLRAQRLLC
jgi:hypothetical protein